MEIIGDWMNKTYNDDNNDDSNGMINKPLGTYQRAGSLVVERL
jgi:hypothetical protein